MNKLRIFSYSLIVITIIVITVKFTFFDYAFHKILPAKKYEVIVDINSAGFNQPVNITTFLPESDYRQTIINEVNNSPNFSFQIQTEKTGKVGRWDNPNLNSDSKITYSYEFIGKAIQYEIDNALFLESQTNPSLIQYLEPTKNIQVNHPQIQKIYDEKVGKTRNVNEVLRNIFDYTYSLKPKTFKGVTDALTAARLGEASCNGKSRLFIALSRTAGIPSRLVGGLILENTSKKTSHQWVEVYVKGEWIPFDPLNNHYAFLPHNYLSLYKGDEFLFSHTPNINFDYLFTIKARLSPNPALISELKSNPLNAYNLWAIFEKIGIPLGLLKIILLLPLGALIVAIFRNVIGMKTFGVFLPALIAVASRETGLMWGLIAFLIVIAVVSLIHFPMEKWGILYTPKLVIMLIGVVVLFIFIAYISIELNVISLAYIALFPIVVLTISAERFARTISEDGFKEALLLAFQTLIVSAISYFAMNSNSMEAFFLGFPELFLAIIGINLLLGKWIGIRFIEYFRFKFLIK